MNNLFREYKRAVVASCAEPGETIVIGIAHRSASAMSAEVVEFHHRQERLRGVINEPRGAKWIINKGDYERP